MKTMNYKTIKKVVCRSIAGMLLLSTVSCDGTMEDSLRYNYPASGSNYDSGHVLLVVMDGAAGRSVQSARNADKTPNLKTMMLTRCILIMDWQMEPINCLMMNK